MNAQINPTGFSPIQTRAEISQNWTFKAHNWIPCNNYLKVFLDMESVHGQVDEAFEAAGYKKQIDIRRGTWKFVEGTLALYVNETNSDMPIYCIRVSGERGMIGMVWIETFPDLLGALTEFTGMLAMFDGLISKPGTPS